MDADGNSTVPLWAGINRALLQSAAPANKGGNLWLLVVIFVFLVIFGAYFAGTESAISAVSKIKIKSKADEGDKRAKGVLSILNRFEKAITTLLIGNNITHIAAASVATVIATRLLDRGSMSDLGFSMLCTVVSTGVIFLFSEMIPKSFANDRAQTTAYAASGFLRVLMKVLSPLSAFFGLISKGATRLFGGKEAPSITEDELKDILDTVEEEGVVDETQSDMLKSALEFNDTVVGDVMTMLKDTEMLPVTATPSQVLEIIKASNHSRLPVYQGDQTYVIGTLRVRNYLTEYAQNAELKVRLVMSAPYFVSRSAKIDDVLTDMRQHKHHMAIVLDEDKKAVGVVTIEDFLEELVGEIFDEEDVVDQNFHALGGNKYLVNTHMLTGVVYERMGLPAAPASVASKPLISMLIEKLGHVPAEEEEIIIGNLEITVEDCENGSPLRVIVHVMDGEDLARLAAQADAEKDGPEENASGKNTSGNEEVRS